MEYGSWTVCKGEYSVEKPIDPHTLTCNQPSKAKYIRISISNGGYGGLLCMIEVKVLKKKGEFLLCSFVNQDEFLKHQFITWSRKLRELKLSI